MTKEESWLYEKMHQCFMLVEEFNNTYNNWLFDLFRQAFSSDEGSMLYAISCTKINILLNLKHERLDLNQLRELVFELYSIYNNSSSDVDLEKQKLSEQEKELCREIQVYQVLNQLIQLSKLEYNQEYKSTIYKRFIDCIFSSIQQNYLKQSKTMEVLSDTKNFLHQLTEKEQGELIVEHFTVNYARNQGLFLSYLSTFPDYNFSKIAPSIFVDIIETLGREFCSLNLEEKLQKLERVYLTDFYRNQFISSTFGTK